VVIAIALACGPDLLVADEPTTALDVTIQREVLDLIAELVREDGMGLLLISHDLGVMADTVQRMLVMYGGTVVEAAPRPRCSAAWPTPTRAGCSRPGRGWGWRAAPGWPPSPGVCPNCRHARRLPLRRPLRARRRRLPPRPPPVQIGAPGPRCALHPLGRGMTACCCRRSTCTSSTGCRARACWRTRPVVQALDGVGFTLQRGRSLGVVGESGSGKSTLARLVMALEAPTAGQVLFDGAGPARAGRRPRCAARAPASRWCSRTRTAVAGPAPHRAADGGRAAGRAARRAGRRAA
jgi:peptide/nickel transport system ATP-binding protein